jgi:hypothetical protein
MFKTAGVCFIRRAFSGLSLVCLAVILGACAHPPTTDSGEPESRVFENVASKSTAELYADLIAPAVFERSSSKVIDGYTVESGKLRMPDKSEGALVTVRSVDGSLTALINKPGQFGSLHVDSKGGSQFISEPETNTDFEDAVPNPNEQVATAPVDSAQAEHFVVDVLMGYSKAGVDRAGGDAHADALAKIELVNMMLRNSLVDNVSLRLVGIQVVEDNYPITSETLGGLRTIFAEGMAKFEPDVTYGNFAVDIVPGGVIGMGWMPGRSAIGASNRPSTFAHEIGHNAGSHHCNDNGVNNYRFGYFNGKSRSILCKGPNSIYYSTPAVLDQYGLPLGNAVTADTARVWRENAARLSSYAPPQSPPTAPGNFVKARSSANTITFGWNASPKAVRYEIYRVNVASDPLPKKIGDSTALTFTATSISGEALYFVKAVSFIGLVSVPSNSVVARP